MINWSERISGIAFAADIPTPTSQPPILQQQMGKKMNGFTNTPTTRMG
jgi:hypothetical protein